VTVASYQSLLNHFRDMLASSPAVRSFLQSPNERLATRNAILLRAANEQAVAVQSVETGDAGECSFTVRGDHSRVFTAGTKSRFGDSPSRSELTTVSAVAYDDGENLTTVSVSEAIAAATDSEPFTVRGQSCPRIIAGADNVSIRKTSQTCGDFSFDRGMMLIAMEWEPDTRWYDPSIELDDVGGAGDEFGRHVDAILKDLQRYSGNGSTASGITWIDFHGFDITFEPQEVYRPEANDGRPMWSAIIEGAFGGVG
jgi:hypothetical protein